MFYEDGEMKLLSVTRATRNAFGKLCFAVTLALYSAGASAVPRNVVAGPLAASSRQVAFSVQEENSVGLVIADLKFGSVTELKSPGNRLVFPYLSPDGSRLLVVRQHPDNGTSDLLSCTTDTFRCKQLHTSTGSISSPTEIDEHRILFVSSQSRNDSENLRSKYLGFKVGKYVNHDVWRLDVGQPPTRVTDFELHELGDLCVTATSVYFHGAGPRPEKPVIPKFEPLQRPASEIYRVPLELASGLISLPHTQLKPQFLQEGYTFAAKVSEDESLSALIRTTTNWPSGGGYRYDLVIQNLKTGVSRTLLPSSRLGFSRPVFLGNTVLVSEIFDYKYIITRIADDLSSQSVLEISDASIIHASTVEIASDLEAR
jgi:hypothetical protein